jgi:signal transduction histidine kinase
VRASRDDDEVEIEVVDDGVGGASVERGSGIRGLGDRVEALGGSFGLDSPAGKGTRVWARIPLSATQPYG